MIAHVGDSNDLDYIRRLAASGAYLGWDRFNIEHFNPDAKRIETRDCRCSRRGTSTSIHFSHDGATFHDFMVGDPVFADEHADYLHVIERDPPAAPGARRYGRRHRPDHGRQPRRWLATLDSRRRRSVRWDR